MMGTYSPIMRSATWHSGRKAMRSSPSRTPSKALLERPASTEQTLRWVIIAPLGRPVVPEV
jgi:hypothetical protein